MNLLDKLGEKATQTYQVTKEKAITLSEEIKMKTQISKLKRQINNKYRKIGNIVYDEVKNGKNSINDEIITECDEISKFKDEIVKLEKDILSIKKMKKCVNCGAEIELDDTYCSKCGKQQPEQEKPKAKSQEPKDEIKQETKQEIKSEEPKEAVVAKEAEVILIDDTSNKT